MIYKMLCHLHIVLSMYALHCIDIYIYTHTTYTMWNNIIYASGSIINIYGAMQSIGLLTRGGKQKSINICNILPATRRWAHGRINKKK